MFEYQLGVSVTGITPVITLKNLPLLADSRIATFEFRQEVFDGDVSGKVRAATREMLEKTGKRFISCHIPFSRIDDVSDPEEEVRLCAVSRLRRQLDEAYFFGSGIIVLHPSTEISAEEPRKIRMMQLRKSLWELQDTLRAHRMKLALEWLPRMCLGNSLDELKEMLRDLDRNVLGICLDVNHMMGAYSNLPQIVESIGSDLTTLHLSDYDGIDEKHWMPGEGVIDWEAFLGALRRIHYRGPFNYECRLYGENESERIAGFEKNFYEYISKL